MANFHGFEPCTPSGSNLIGSTVQMASIALDAKPRGPLDSKNCFEIELEDLRNLKIASKLVKFLDFMPITALVVRLFPIFFSILQV